MGSENCWSEKPLICSIIETRLTHPFILQTFIASYCVPGARDIKMTKARSVPELTIQGEWLISKHILVHILNVGKGELYPFLLNLALKNEFDFASTIKERTFREHSKSCWNVQSAKAWKNMVSLWNVWLWHSERDVTGSQRARPQLGHKQPYMPCWGAQVLS